eukprot:2416786-Amphidinium_carterae.1
MKHSSAETSPELPRGVWSSASPNAKWEAPAKTWEHPANYYQPQDSWNWYRQQKEEPMPKRVSWFQLLSWLLI